MGFWNKLLGRPEWVPATTVDRFAGDGMTMTPKKNNTANWFTQDKQVFAEKLTPGQKVTIKWDYNKLTKGEIDEIIGHCGCTADIKHGSVGISAVFTHQEKEVPAGGKEYVKYLTVYYKDGLQKIRNENGVMVWPENKVQRTLSFSGWLMP